MAGELKINADFGSLDNKLNLSTARLRDLEEQSKKTSESISQGFRGAAKDQEKFAKSVGQSNKVVKAAVTEEEKLIKQISTLEKEAVELREELKELNKGTEAYTLSQSALRRNSRELNTALKKLDKGLETTGKQAKKSGGIIQNALSFVDQRFGTNFTRLFARVKTGLGGAVKGFKTLKVAIASTGIGLLVIAVASLFAFFTKTQEGSERLRVIFAKLRAGVDVLIDRFSTLGEGLIQLFSGQVEAGLSSISSAFSGLGREMQEEIRIAGEMAEALIGLIEEENNFVILRARTNSLVAESRVIAEDDTKTQRERIAALKNANEVNKGVILTEQQILKGRARLLLSDQSFINLERQLAIVRTQGGEALSRESVGLKKSVEEDRKAVLDLFARIINLETAAFKVEKELQLKVNQLQDEELQNRRKAAAQREKQEKEAADKILKIQEQLNKDLNSLQNEGFKASVELASDEERIDLIEKASKAALDILRKEILDRKEALGQARELTAEEEQQIADIRNAIFKKSTESFNKLQDAKNEDDIARIEAQGLLEIAQLKKSGDNQLTLEQFKQREILKVQLAAARARLALIEDQGSVEALALKRQILKIQDEVSSFIEESDISIGGELLQKLFEITDEDAEKIVKGITDVSALVSDAFAAGIDEAVEANDEIINALDDRIDKLEEVVETEKELNEQGFANNLSIRQKELVDLKRQRAEALAIQEAAVKKQTALDKIATNAKLTLAIANIIATFTSTLGPLGLILAGAAITGLLNLFSNSVAKANTVTLEKGGSNVGTGVFSGQRHSQGGETMSDHVNVEQGEGWSVFNRSATRKHGDLIQGFTSAVNSGNPLDFFSMPDFSNMQEISERKNKFIQNSISTRNMERNQRRGHDIMKGIRDKKQTTTSGNKTIMHYGNTTRITRN